MTAASGPRLLGMTTSAFDPASRFRFVQFIPHLENAGWQVAHRPRRPDLLWSSSLPGRIPRALHHRAGNLLMKWNRWHDITSADRFDVVFVNRALTGKGDFFERRLLRHNRRVVFDFDDAIFTGSNPAPARRMCEEAAWVTPGNEYLAEYARRFNSNVTIIPTVIDTDQCITTRDEDADRNDLVRVGWSGSDQSISNALFPHLRMLSEIQRRIPFELVVISNSKPVLPVTDMRWKFHEWRAEDERQLAKKMDIGLMPLVDNAFQRGKCGLKLLQYMAAGIPTIASPVGVNREITLDGRTGMLASTEAEWSAALEALIRSADLRTEMGKSGRERCVEHYSIKAWLPTMLDILRRVGGLPVQPQRRESWHEEFAS